MGRERTVAAQKMEVSNANKALIRCSYSNDRFTVNLNSFGKAPDALHQAPLVPVTSRYLMARMSKLWTLATTPSSHPPENGGEKVGHGSGGMSLLRAA